MNAITYNIRSFQGSVHADSVLADEGPGSADVLGRVADALAALEPHVVCLQEVRREAWAADLARRLGMRYAYFPGGWRSDGWPEGISGAVLTRGEILESLTCPMRSWPRRPEELFTRFWGTARLTTPWGELVVHAAHLHHVSPEYRLREVEEILAVMAAEDEAGESVMLMGDLNHEPDSAEHARLTEAGLVDAFAAAGRGPERTWPSIEPEMRIDYIRPRGPIAARLADCRVVCAPPFSADRTGLALSDHLPVLASFA